MFDQATLRQLADLIDNRLDAKLDEKLNARFLEFEAKIDAKFDERFEGFESRLEEKYFKPMLRDISTTALGLARLMDRFETETTAIKAEIANLKIEIAMLREDVEALNSHQASMENYMNMKFSAVDENFVELNIKVDAVYTAIGRLDKRVTKLEKSAAK